MYVMPIIIWVKDVAFFQEKGLIFSYIALMKDSWIKRKKKKILLELINHTLKLTTHL